MLDPAENLLDLVSAEVRFEHLEGTSAAERPVRTMQPRHGLVARFEHFFRGRANAGQPQQPVRLIRTQSTILLASAEGPEWSGTAVNLSREGCAIRSARPVHQGDDLGVLIFPCANQTPIEVGVARVRWATQGQFGVEFMMLAPRDATRLQDLLTIMGA